MFIVRNFSICRTAWRNFWCVALRRSDVMSWLKWGWIQLSKWIWHMSEYALCAHARGVLNHTRLQLVIVRHSSVMCFLLGLRIESQRHSWKRSWKGEASHFPWFLSSMRSAYWSDSVSSLWLNNYEYSINSDRLTHADYQKCITCSPYPSAVFHMLIHWQQRTQTCFKHSPVCHWSFK